MFGKGGKDMKKTVSGRFFDEDYFTGKSKKKGGDRSKDSGVQFQLAATLVKFFGKGVAFLDAGCGMGFCLRHLQNMGVTAVGFDISKYAVKNSVAKDVKSGSVIKPPKMKGPFGVVYSANVLGYLADSDVDKALKALNALTDQYLVLGIVTDASNDASYGQKTRKDLRTGEWWEKRFKKAKLNLAPLTAQVREANGWKNIWIFSK